MNNTFTSTSKPHGVTTVETLVTHRNSTHCNIRLPFQKNCPELLTSLRAALHAANQRYSSHQGRPLSRIIEGSTKSKDIGAIRLSLSRWHPSANVFSELQLSSARIHIHLAGIGGDPTTPHFCKSNILQLLHCLVRVG
jgi:hypothetical protein